MAAWLSHHGRGGTQPVLQHSRRATQLIIGLKEKGRKKEERKKRKKRKEEKEEKKKEGKLF